MKCSIIILLVAIISWITVFASDTKETIASSINTNEAGNQRLINGILDARGDSPYHVYIRAQTNFAVSTYCGGTLLVNNWVLTSASCLSEAVTATLSFGVFERIAFNEAGRVNRQINVANFEFPDNLADNPDIALIRVIPPVDTSAFILAAAYATDPEEKYIDTTAIITGFGEFTVGSIARSEILGYSFGTVLRGAACPTLVTSECQYFDVSASNNVETAYGDSGSPAVVFTASGAALVIGVATFEQDARANALSTYTYVAPYASWITEVLST